MLKIAVLFAALLGVAVAQPYASWTEYFYSGCNASTTANYVSDIYVYPADGSCFTPSGGLSSSGTWSYTIAKVNDTTVNITEYYDVACTDLWGYDLYPIDACPAGDYYVISLWEELPDTDYWADVEVTGYYGPWETVVVVDYFSAAACPEDNWIDTEVLGWEECDTGSHFYCDDDEIHYDGCTDTTDCASGCIEIYEPLDDSCTDTSAAPTYWSSFIDDASTSYTATCVGGSSSSSTLVASVAVVVAALALVF